ncbi:hypothetical protein ACP3PM_27365 [Pseudomonas iridis]
MEPKDTKISDLKISHLIKIFREIAVLVVATTLTIKLLTGSLGLDFAKLSASELVSILLAFFSIALSAAFYFAATNQSNQFYDNVNNFTKDTSTLLGRLDEQVKGIGGRQSELKDSIEKHYRGGTGVRVERAQEETEKQFEEAKSGLASIVDELLDKARLDPAEKENFENRIKEKDVELDQLREKLVRISTRTEMQVRRYTRRMLKKIGFSEALTYTPAELLYSITKDAFPQYLKDLAALGYIKNGAPSSPQDVTKDGEKMVKNALDTLSEKDDED